jgi:hypothetical protein
VGVKRHPPAFSRFGASGSRRHGGRLAGGSPRCLLTATVDELVDRSMAASPDDQSFESTSGTRRHRTGAGVAQSSGPARPRPVRRVGSSTGFAGTRLAARSRSGSSVPSRGRAKPGGTLLTPTPAEHPADPPSIPSKGMPPGEGTFLLRWLYRNLCRHPGEPRGLSGGGTSASGGASRPQSWPSDHIAVQNGQT